MHLLNIYGRPTPPDSLLVLERVILVIVSETCVIVFQHVTQAKNRFLVFQLANS